METGHVCDNKNVNNGANVAHWWLILYLLMMFPVALETLTS